MPSSLAALYARWMNEWMWYVTGFICRQRFIRRNTLYVHNTHTHHSIPFIYITLRNVSTCKNSSQFFRGFWWQLCLQIGQLTSREKKTSNNNDNNNDKHCMLEKCIPFIRGKMHIYASWSCISFLWHLVYFSFFFCCFSLRFCLKMEILL